MRIFECQRKEVTEFTKEALDKIIYDFLYRVLEINDSDLTTSEKLDITNFINDTADEVDE